MRSTLPRSPLLLFLLVGLLPMAARSQVVSVAEQRARDSDRAAILRAELDQERAAAESAAEQVTSRRAAGDGAGAVAAQRAQAAAESDIAALQREIAMTALVASRPNPVVPSPHAPGAQHAQAPWWDVYSRPPAVAPSVLPSPPAASPGHP
jgi:hypothetical protein